MLEPLSGAAVDAELRILEVRAEVRMIAMEAMGYGRRFWCLLQDFVDSQVVSPGWGDRALFPAPFVGVVMPDA